MELSEEVAFHQAIRSTLTKGQPRPPSPTDLNFELRQLLSEAVVGDGVMDVFEIAGLKNPDISVLSDEFLQEVRKLPQKNLAVELLRRLINDEVRSKFSLNYVKQQKFSELLQQSLSRYSTRVIDAAQVIEELIAMAKQIKEDLNRARQFDLTAEEHAFYDALANNQSAQELMGETVLVEIAREAAEKLRSNLTVDWAKRESVRAKLRIILRGLLRKHKYPPDQQQEAIDLVIRQAEIISESEVSADA